MSKLGEWTFSADGNGAWITLDHVVPFEGVAYGDFGGGTLTFQSSPDGGTTAIPVADVSLTANAYTGTLNGARGHLIRPVLSGATSPDLIVALFQIAKN